MLCASPSVCLTNLLLITGIRKSNVPRFKFRSFCMTLLHPFPFLMYLVMFHKIIVLILLDGRSFFSDSKARIFSSFSSILSVVLWHIIYFHKNKIHSLLANCHQNPAHKSYTNNSYQNKSDYKISFCFISLNFFTIFIMPACLVLSKSVSLYIDCWIPSFIKSESNCINYVILFFTFFLYFAELIFPSTIFLLIFCFLTLNLVHNLEEAKYVIKVSNVWHDSISYHSQLHEKLIKRVESFDKTFSLPIFILLCLMTTVAFTGLALEIEPTGLNLQHIVEGFLCLYFSVIGIITVIHVASKVSQQLDEINRLYRKNYESIVVKNESPFTPNEVKKLAILKVICKRPIIKLTAWKLFCLDKSLLFPIFGTMLTYGFLIIQLRDK